jgi:hypothetical protein
MSPVDFVSCSPSDFVSTGSLSLSLQAPLKAQEAYCRAIVQKLELAMSVVTDFEWKLGITERWTENSVEFQATWAYIQHQDFIRAIEHLEGLVVQRLFELAKANLTGTGMSIVYN